tara:strand:- start:2651 stop:3376 length:726 start_codon:yes stop_codon:yes gene_type:complete
MNKKKFSVSGMTCDGCVQSIKTKLELEDDIDSVEVSLNDEYLLLSSKKNYKESELNDLLKSIGSYKVSEDYQKPNIIKIIAKYLSTYKPILITLIFVFLLSFLSYEVFDGTADSFMRFAMGYFFLIFSFLKFQDISQFASSFSNYDPITKTFYKFGLIYPFIELSLGIFFILGVFLLFSNILTLLILLPQTYGIFMKLRRKEEMINCACLGTSFSVPLSNLTILENISMCIMAIFFIVVII